MPLNTDKEAVAQYIVGGKDKRKIQVTCHMQYPISIQCYSTIHTVIITLSNFKAFGQIWHQICIWWGGTCLICNLIAFIEFGWCIRILAYLLNWNLNSIWGYWKWYFRIDTNYIALTISFVLHPEGTWYRTSSLDTNRYATSIFGPESIGGSYRT